MRFAAMIALLAAAPTAHAQLTTDTATLEKVLPGIWAMVLPDPPDSDNPPVHQCDKFAIEIRFVRDPDGTLIYESEALGPDVADLPLEDRISRGKVQNPLSDPRARTHAFEVQYEGETRLDTTGKPQTWRLIMTGPDEFYWQQTVWPPGYYTAPSLRCPSPGPIG